MKIKAYNQEDAEFVVTLALRNTCRGVVLCVVDVYGNRVVGGELLEINNAGVMRRKYNVSRDIGVVVDLDGKITEVDLDGKITEVD